MRLDDDALTHFARVAHDKDLNDDMLGWKARAALRAGNTPKWPVVENAINAMSADVASGVLKPGSVTEKTLSKYLNSGFLPDVDLFLRSSGEQRTSNFLLWQSAYAEFVFMDTLWPDFDRSSLWDAIGQYVSRDRRFGGAIDKPKTKKSK